MAGPRGVPKYVCTQCSYKGKPVRWKPGSARLEIILWLCALVPGLVYSIWRWKHGVPICPNCRTATMISTKGPHGQRMMGA